MRSYISFGQSLLICIWLLIIEYYLIIDYIF